MTRASSKNETSGAQVVNCWNSIGVWGRERPRCPLLDEVIHCRNCEKYISAGQRAFDRSPPDDYVQEWTRVIAREKTLEFAKKISVIIFRIGDEWFSLSTSDLQQVDTRRAIHSLPHGKSTLIKGVANIGGEVKLCFSIGGLLGIEKSSLNDPLQRTAIYEGLIALRKNSKSYVFPVTEVREITRISVDELSAVPATVSKLAASYLLGILHHEGLHIGHLDSDLVIAGFERGVS